MTSYDKQHAKSGSSKNDMPFKLFFVFVEKTTCRFMTSKVDVVSF